MSTASSQAPAGQAEPAPAGPDLTVVHVTTVPDALFFLRGQASFMKRAGFSLHAISSSSSSLGASLASFGEQEGIPVHPVEMPRRITPLRDLISIWRMLRVLRKVRPAIVDAHTPKGGLLGMLAATLARAPVRVYHMHGLPFVTASGFRRQLLRWTERVSCLLAHRVLAVSHSIRSLAISEGLCAADKIQVLLGGSVNAVDAVDRFGPLGDPVRSAARTAQGIPPDAIAVGFVGRLVRDKGIVELAQAWWQLRRNPRLHLLLVGPFDATDALPGVVIERLQTDPRVHFTGSVTDVPRLYSAMDVLALPTYREGFPQVALEAAAMGLPVVATSIPGCVDAVRDGETGTLVPARDAEALTGALQRYSLDASLRAKHGEAGRRRVLAEFRQDAMWEALASEYCRLLAVRRGHPRHRPVVTKLPAESASQVDTASSNREMSRIV